MNLTKILSGIPLFSGLSRQQYQHLRGIALEQKYKQGQIFFSEGDKGAGFYVIISGKVKIYKLSGDGKEQIIHIMGHNETFGEAAAFAGKPFPAFAQALAECRVLFFPRIEFMKLLEQSPSLASSMLASLSRRLLILASLVENLSLKEVPNRIAVYLLYLSERQKRADDVELDISKNQMAALLGTIPETLSRILKRMSGEKLIKTRGRHIQILNRNALDELACGIRKLS
ncbi:MAG TPA: Crp/Fnr family transcriptional regulator [Deltaproteobacteria bacterium]|nr:Crp/Fnr family transcriptional regulator [Deltaproteobacteria bacterium]